MENLVEKINLIVEDYKKIENITPEEHAVLKNRLFELYGEISTIREACEYYKADMVIDNMDQMFVSGFYSGVVNGSMFVVNAMLNVLSKEQSDKDTVDAIVDKLKLIQGLNSEED